LGLRKGIIRIESRKIHTVRLAAVELEIRKSSIQRMLRKGIKAFPYKLQTVHKLEEEDNDRRVEMCETLTIHPSLTIFGSVMKLFFICVEE